MSATTENYQVNLIYARVYVADQELPYAVAAVIRSNDISWDLLARFTKRFANLTTIAPVEIPAEERNDSDEDEVFVDNAIWV